MPELLRLFQGKSRWRSRIGKGAPPLWLTHGKNPPLPTQPFDIPSLPRLPRQSIQEMDPRVKPAGDVQRM
jgi:hypothetical protein